MDRAIKAGRARAFVLAAALTASLMTTQPSWATQTVIITRADCTRLVAHTPAPGVAYRPGADARGRPVVPADLGGRPDMKFPETVDIPVVLELLQRLGLPANSSLYKLDDVTVGTARVRVRDGRAWFNGVALTSEEHHVMARACQKLGSGGTP